MSKKSILSLFLLFSFSLLLFYSCNNSSPTTPEIPKKKAIVKISLGNDPVVLYEDETSGCWYPSLVKPEVIISETNGVGCNISIVKLELMYQGTPTWPITKEGGRIEGFGSLAVVFSDLFTCSTAYDRIKITVEGGDDNDFKISTSAYFDILYVGSSE